ncbi:aminoglycoside 2'-N-acetyltransferase I [Amycolatopsis marina]|uniref:Aminoglycoside 2'-N-acetyltransferase I n=1 Tax=Amycolatopsis marina TaxID=490629 RepID=A0A1I0VH70_9PSEU|nr:GNAT family N-acetyltransferase [Amycolatopsis marina]SFA75377.1 aminoglycoside 2'-N-acetyltransferase I [Amycolatopsis marina]
MTQTLSTDDLDKQALEELRLLLDLAFRGEFSEHDWAHTLGGWHAMVRHGDELVAHAAVIPRTVRIGMRTFRTGYVEGMATHPAHRRRGHANTLMEAVNEHIRSTYDLGALSDGTEIDGFYQRHGWVTWFGRSSVDRKDGWTATPEEDGSILVLRTPATARVDLTAPIACDWRPGDVW